MYVHLLRREYVCLCREYECVPRLVMKNTHSSFLPRHFRLMSLQILISRQTLPFSLTPQPSLKVAFLRALGRPPSPPPTSRRRATWPLFTPPTRSSSFYYRKKWSRNSQNFTPPCEKTSLSVDLFSWLISHLKVV